MSVPACRAATRRASTQRVNVAPCPTKRPRSANGTTPACPCSCAPCTPTLHGLMRWLGCSSVRSAATSAGPRSALAIPRRPRPSCDYPRLPALARFEAAWSPRLPALAGLGPGDQLTQHQRKNAAVVQVLDLGLVVDPRPAREIRDLAVVADGLNRHLLTRLDVVEAGDREPLLALQPQPLRALARRVLQREDAHADQVRAVDPLVAFRDHRSHAEQKRPLGGPVARGTCSVFLAGEDDQRRTLLRIRLGGIEDRHLLPVRKVTRPVALARREGVAQPDVSERAAHHHLVVAPPRAEAVEVESVHARLDQISAGRAVDRDRARG